MVYIHGGGFVQGNPLGWPFEHWIKQYPDIVIVSVYYRLGIFGFMTAPDAGSAIDSNAGILDQVEALRWVKEVGILLSHIIYRLTRIYRTLRTSEEILKALPLTVKAQEPRLSPCISS